MIIKCIIIFFARIVDVSLSTIKTVFSVRGKQFIAAIIAFFEVLVWFIVARSALTGEITSIFIPICYALGYACGTLIGTYISINYIKGPIMAILITMKNNINLINKLRKNGYGVSICNLKNTYNKEKKDLLLIELDNKNLKKFTKLIKKYAPKSFLTINETRVTRNGYIK